MNANILKKCIDKLKEEKPDIQYVLGMLETLFEMQQMTTASGLTPERKVLNNSNLPPKSENLTDADILNKEAEERLKGIKDIAQPI